MAAIAIGIDVGTSGVRAVAMAADGSVVARHGAPLRSSGGGRAATDPRAWWAATVECLQAVTAKARARDIAALSVDATSGTLLAVDERGAPVGEALLYSDPVEDADLVDLVNRLAPLDSPARGTTSPLARALVLMRRPGAARVLHQADWVLGRLTGRTDLTDTNNALKTGFDPGGADWPSWIATTGLDSACLPRVVTPGTPIGPATDAAAHETGLPATTLICAGTTDGCAAFLAAGASAPGEAVTSLGTTLVLKVGAARPVGDPTQGIYSHRLGAMWLPGGASNSGGGALAPFFDGEAIARLSTRIDPMRDSGLDYYPLPRPGERFPVNDPALQPRLEPRPEDDAMFLHGLLEGIARIERLGYERLAALGAPYPTSVRSVGGGAANPVWTAMRERILGVPVLPAASEDTAAGAARLAWQGARQAGVAA
ncbi:FGGY-family carbohydrate kinase [Alsobacter sp. R-9]